MVWIVEGTIQSRPGDSPEALPEPTTHWLRPDRKYRAGRSGGLRPPSRLDSKKPGPATRSRPFDFRVASLKVPKDGLFEAVTGGRDWDSNDRPDAPDNLKPYSLTATVRSKCKLYRRPAAEPVDLVPDETGSCKVEVKDGDHFEHLSLVFTFRWKPIILNFPSAKAEQKASFASFAKRAGIKIAYGEMRAHHTHLITKKANTNKNLLVAAMSQAHVVHPDWYGDFKIACQEPPYPSERIPEAPEPRRPGEDAAAYKRRVQKYEDELLAIEPDVGSDAPKWWGHSMLEQDWKSAWPSETDEQYRPLRSDGTREPDTWIPDERRKTLFQGILLANYFGNAELLEWQEKVMTLGGGHFYASSVLQTSPLPTSATELAEALAAYRSAMAISQDVKIVVVPPPGLFTESGLQDSVSGDQPPELDEDSMQQKELLLDLEDLLGATLLNDVSVAFGHAIADVDPGPLLSGMSRSPELQAPPATSGAPSTMGLPEQTLPFPSGGVPGTHPDSMYPTTTGLSGGIRSQAALAANTQGQASHEAGPSDWTKRREPEASEDLEPRQPKKLVRRARTGRSAVQDMLDRADDDSAARSTGPSYLTQDLGAGASAEQSATRHATESPALAEDEPMQSSLGETGTSTRRGKLSRRAGQKSALQAWLDGDVQPSSQASGTAGAAGATQSMSGSDSVRAGKTREERLRAIQEEDERRAAEEAERYEQRKKQEEAEQKKSGPIRRERGAQSTNVGKEAAGPSRKRGKSAAAGESDSGDSASDRPARKLGSRKEGSAAMSSTNKRSRARRTGDDSSSAEERGTRKKSRGPSPARESPKSKKEAVAQRKAAKEAETAERDRLLQVKTTKRKGADIDKALNDDFNALKIVKPVIKPMPRQEKHRLGWEEEDSDAERDRLIHADQEHLDRQSGDDEMDPDRWRQATQAMFVVKPLQVESRPRRGGSEPVDPKWAGRPNFKRFRPKHGQAARASPAHRVQCALVLPEAVDFGLGKGYGEGQSGSLSQARQDDENEDEDIFSFAGAASKTQGKLSYGGAKGGAKGGKTALSAGGSKSKANKGKAKRVVADSDDAGSASETSNTLKGAIMDIDELDDDNTPVQPTSTRANRARSTSKTAGGGAGTARGTSSRKAPAATIMIDDSSGSDSDSGLTFKGFGKKGR